ncbi:hypothetical protein [Pseudogemmobacter faecipullorum]|uniref:Uncharacterized protein n=1 Tax=Pseudogemmobacter faecipullorum TaxID=2755041 RepID=A0ABS8CL05_9RHOB|nr:hypothetical protein [Pseudogemmobacter faecipullorum]MCB5409843.1 hypothetical protein [Pseudogemmobacter faecipullorum]
MFFKVMATDCRAAILSGFISGHAMLRLHKAGRGFALCFGQIAVIALKMPKKPAGRTAKTRVRLVDPAKGQG